MSAQRLVDRRIAPLSGGVFEGPRLRGTILPGDEYTVDDLERRFPMQTILGANGVSVANSPSTFPSIQAAFDKSVVHQSR